MRRPTADDPVTEIDAAIRFQRATRAEAQIELEAAVHRREVAMADVDAAQVDIAKARALIKARDVDIDKLLEERLRHVPYQRRPID